MKSTLNVFRAGLASCIAASLLAGCSDGRGMGGFKSYRSTPEQRAEWLAKNGGEAPADGPATNDVKDKDGTINPGTLQEGPGTDTKGADSQTAVTDKPGDNVVTAPAPSDLLRDFESEEAKTQVLTELGEQPSEDPAQQRVVNQAELIVANDEALKLTDQTASTLIKGISIIVEGAQGERVLSLDAVVQVGADVRTLHVVQAPLNKVTGDGRTLNLPIILKKVDTLEEVQAGDKIYVMGNCKDTACNSVQVRIEFALDSGSKSAAVFLVQLTGQGYQVTHSNIGELQGRDFATAFSAAGGKAAPVDEKPVVDAPVTDAPAVDTAVVPDATSTDKPVLVDTRAEAIREHREAMNPAAKVDVGGVADVVNGTTSVALTDTRAEAIREHREALAAAKTTAKPAVALTDTRAEAIREHREALAAAKTTAKPAVALIDTRAEAIREHREVLAAAAKRKAERDLAIRNGVLTEWEAKQKGKPAAVVAPPTDAQVKAAALKARYDAQLKAGAYRGAAQKAKAAK